jgi:hypothetical protein
VESFSYQIYEGEHSAHLMNLRSEPVTFLGYSFKKATV